MDLKVVRQKYRVLQPELTERSRRLWAATEAAALGHGGIALVERATGISRATIQRVLRELEAGEVVVADRTRRLGGGRKRAVEKDRRLLRDLDALVEPTASGVPDAPLRWTAKSVRVVAKGVAEVYQPYRVDRSGVSRPTGHQQMEQDRTPPLLPFAMSWRGKPLISLAAIVSLIADTHTDTGLRVRSEIDTGHDPRRCRRHGRANGADQPVACSLSRRLELSHPSIPATLNQSVTISQSLRR